jgi:hypothetical protein
LDREGVVAAVFSVWAVKIDLTVVILLASSPKSVVSVSMKGEDVGKFGGGLGGVLTKLQRREMGV